MTKQNAHSSNKGLMTHLTVAGTAALAASNAGAQIIVTNVNVDVGYGPGGKSSFTSALPGLSQFIIYRGNPASTAHFLGIYGTFAPNKYLAFKSTFTSLGLPVIIKSPAGQKYGSVRGFATTSAFVAAAFNSVTSTTNGATSQFSYKYGYTPFTDGYFLFKFADTTNGNQLDYGYIKASLTDNTFGGMNLHISSYAYDLSGRQIAAGALPAAVPEPGAEMALAALSALSLGAVGVRRMKALKA